MANIPAAFLKKPPQSAAGTGPAMGMPKAFAGKMPGMLPGLPGKAAGGAPSDPAAMMAQMAQMAKMMAAMGASPPPAFNMPKAAAPGLGGMGAMGAPAPHGHLMMPSGASSSGGNPMMPGPVAPGTEEPVEFIDGRPKANLVVPDGVVLGPADIKQQETGVSIGKIPDKKENGEELSLDEMVRLAGKRVIDAGGYQKIGYNRKADEERGIQRGKVQVNRVINTPYLRDMPPAQPSYPGGKGSLGPMY